MFVSFVPEQCFKNSCLVAEQQILEELFMFDWLQPLLSVLPCRCRIPHVGMFLESFGSRLEMKSLYHKKWIGDCLFLSKLAGKIHLRLNWEVKQKMNPNNMNSEFWQNCSLPQRNGSADAHTADLWPFTSSAWAGTRWEASPEPMITTNLSYWSVDRISSVRWV